MCAQLPTGARGLNFDLRFIYFFHIVIQNSSVNSVESDLLFCNHLEEEEKAGCLAIVVVQMYCYYKCSPALPHSAVGWSAVCDCGNS